MTKKRKTTAKKKKPTTKRKKPYLSADKLGIAPEERTALISFVKARVYDKAENIMALDGRKHLYNQSFIDDTPVAVKHNCGTAGCVAGYVFHHIKFVQKKRSFLGAYHARDYMEERTCKFGVHGSELLYGLYTPATYVDAKNAQTAVDHMLRTGDIDSGWPLVYREKIRT